MQILSKDFVEIKVGGELELTKAKKDTLILKVKELLGVGKKEFKELQDELEQYCVFTLGEHYTSEQLKLIVESVATELAPKEAVLEPIVEEIITK